MARAQSLIEQTNHGLIELRAIVEAELSARGNGENVTWSGDPVELPPKAIQVLALALHELGTNAAKYGALRQSGGQLGVTWRVQDDKGKGRVVLDWHESGVTMPASGAADRRGYGTELIERLLPYDLGAETRLEFGRGWGALHHRSADRRLNMRTRCYAYARKISSKGPAWKLEMRQFERNVGAHITGLMKAYQDAAALSRRALLWTASSVVLGFLSTIVGSWPSN